MITTATLPTTIRGLIAEGLIALDTDDGVEGYSVADFIAADIDAEYPDGLAAARAAALGYLGPDCFGVGLTFALLDDLIDTAEIDSGCSACISTAADLYEGDPASALQGHVAERGHSSCWADASALAAHRLGHAASHGHSGWTVSVPEYLA